MTEQEIVNAIKSYAGEHGCTFSEYGNSIIEPKEGISATFRVHWNGSTVDKFYIHNSPIAPPDVIKLLKNLRIVSVYQIGGELLWLRNLVNLQRLDIVVRTENLPKLWECTSTLRELHLWYPKERICQTIPSGIRSLKQLRYLSISTSNYPIELPNWLHELTHLKKVILRNCFIKSIPYSLVQTGLPFIINRSNTQESVGIFLEGITLAEGELSLFSQPREVIEQYYSGTRSTAQECKVIFLGDSETGKSSLIERILHGTFKEGTLPTDGILISIWNTTIDEKPFRLRILDFGGQEIMHSMHRCFLSSHTVYVVVCASRNDSEIDRAAERWIENVKTFAPGCPVILVLNKEDLNRHASVNERDLRNINPFLRCVLKTSAKRDDDPGVANLIKEIQYAVTTCINNIDANAGVLGVKQDLELMEKDYISYDEYLEICDKHNVKDGQEGLLHWFKDLGIAYTFSTELQDVQVLNPEWLTNGIYRLILRTPENGFLAHKTIRETLKQKNSKDSMPEKVYTPQEAEFILHVMRTFEISHNMSNGIEIIPLKMEKTPPKKIDNFSKSDTLHLQWKAHYLPFNLIHRLMIRKVEELDKECVWRTGGLFKGYQCVALVEMNETTLDLYVTGPFDRRQYMQEFRTEIWRILESLNIKAEEVICYRIENQEGQIPYEDVMQQWLDGRKEIYISGIKKYVSPAKLLHEIYPQPEKEMITNITNILNSNIGNVGDGNILFLHNLASSIQNSELPTDEIIQSLKDALKSYAEDRNTPRDECEEIQRLLKDLKNQQPSGVWEKIRPFLGDAEKLSKIFPFLASSAPAVWTFLTNIIH